MKTTMKIEAECSFMKKILEEIKKSCNRTELQSIVN